MVEKVEKLCGAQYMIREGFEYIFQDKIDILFKSSTHYLLKWVTSCQLAMKNNRRMTK